jgi:3-isopropylmalate dehydrogenase
MAVDTSEAGGKMKNRYEIAVVHGDGIGPEVCKAAVEVLRAAIASGKNRFYPLT